MFSRVLAMIVLSIAASWPRAPMFAQDTDAAGKPSVPDTPKRTTLAVGQITDANGTGIRGVAICARPAGAAEDAPPIATATTDAVGDFTLECDQAVSGELVVSFTKPRFLEFVHRFSVDPGSPPPFIAEALRGDVSLRGRVLDATSGNAVAHADVMVTAQQDERETTTDGEGRFHVAGLSPGQGQISVSAKGYGRERRGIASLDEAGDIEIRLKPERVVRLKILGDDEKPIPGVLVEVIDQQHDDLQGATTDGDGCASLGGIHFDVRTLKARLSHPDYVSSEFFDRRLELPAEQAESHHDLMMNRAARVRGRVLDAASGAGIHGARVVVGDDDNDGNPRDWTTADGRFTVAGVRPGTIAVTVHRDEYAPELAVVDAKPGECATVDIKLAAGRSVAGHVRDADGKGVASASLHAVRWRDRSTLGLRADSDADGAFVLRNAPPDEFDVVVEAPGRPEVRETLKPPFSADLTITVPKPTNGSEKLLGVGIGDPAPSVTITTLANQKLNPAEMKGKIVVLDFWATWCAPCLEEMKYLAEARKKHAERDDLVMIALSRDTDEDAFRAFLKDNPDKAGWHHVFGEAGGVPAAVKAYGVTWIPRVFVIDHDGRITTINARRDDIVLRIDAAIEAKDRQANP